MNQDCFGSQKIFNFTIFIKLIIDIFELMKCQRLVIYMFKNSEKFQANALDEISEFTPYQASIRCSFCSILNGFTI